VAQPLQTLQRLHAVAKHRRARRSETVGPLVHRRLRREQERNACKACARRRGPRPPSPPPPSQSVTRREGAVAVGGHGGRHVAVVVGAASVFALLYQQSKYTECLLPLQRPARQNLYVGISKASELTAPARGVVAGRVAVAQPRRRVVGTVSYKRRQLQTHQRQCWYSCTSIFLYQQSE
jgi:hypothetical protein